jgi:GNAT superfamily N-acetyltransferase
MDARLYRLSRAKRFTQLLDSGTLSALNLQFDLLTAKDLDEALRLSTQAGWNQLPGDWQRLIDFTPEGCIAGRADGRLVATSTIATYGKDAHWLGMVLVDKECRGRGYGTAILAEALRRAEALGSGAIGLDASDQGRPLYLKMGFADVSPIDRWGGSMKAPAKEPPLEILSHATLDAVLALDRTACGADRSRLLVHLAMERDVVGWVATDSRGAAGYAILRPGRTCAHLGPIVAADPAHFESLLDAAALYLNGAELLLDIPRTDQNSALLAKRGVEIRRRLTRMTHRRAQPLLLGPGVRAAVSFELG